MKTLLLAAAIVILGVNANHSLAKRAPTLVYQTKIVEHGGGCRKNSPPGQCCHMNRKTGTVHCH